MSLFNLHSSSISQVCTRDGAISKADVAGLVDRLQKTWDLMEKSRSVIDLPHSLSFPPTAATCLMGSY